MSTRRRLTLPRTLPMPLWLQAVLELCFAAVGTGVLAALVALVGWASLGTAGGLAGAAEAAGQLWLLGHGVGLHLSIPASGSTQAVDGLMTLTPLGLTYLWLLVVRRSGARLARASYEGEFWKPVLAGVLTYGVLGELVSALTSGTYVSTSSVASFVDPALVALVGLLWGGHRESGSWLRMVGISPEVLATTYSQYTRWAGAYFAAVVRAAWAGALFLVGGGALLAAVALFWNWNDVIALYQTLHAGGSGDTALTLLQLVLVPNFAVFGMAWGIGAGFSLGTGTQVSPALVDVGGLPALPLLGAVPHGTGTFSYAVLVLPVLAGAVAAWWFVRAGEDHLDESLGLKIRARAASAVLSALALGLLIGALVGLGAVLLSALARGSLGIGRFTDVGPHLGSVFLWTLVTVGLGAVMGRLASPWLERDPAADALREEARERQARRRAAEKARRARSTEAGAAGATAAGATAAGVSPEAEGAHGAPTKDAADSDAGSAAHTATAAQTATETGAMPWQATDTSEEDTGAAGEDESDEGLTALERLRRGRIGGFRKTSGKKQATGSTGTTEDSADGVFALEEADEDAREETTEAQEASETPSHPTSAGSGEGAGESPDQADSQAVDSAAPATMSEGGRPTAAEPSAIESSVPEAGAADASEAESRGAAADGTDTSEADAAETASAQSASSGAGSAAASPARHADAEPSRTAVENDPRTGPLPEAPTSEATAAEHEETSALVPAEEGTPSSEAGTADPADEPTDEASDASQTGPQPAPRREPVVVRPPRRTRR